MNRLRRARILTASATLLGFGACSSHGAPRTVTFNALASCLPLNAVVTLSPGGDYPPPQTTTIAVADQGIALPFNPNTRELAAAVGVPSPSFLGLGTVPQNGDVDLLLWSALSPCRVTNPAVAVAGETLGLIDSEHLLLVPGQDNAFLLDLGTGRNSPLTQTSLNVTNATVTPFGNGALVAGGIDVSTNAQFVAYTSQLFTPDPSGTTGAFSRLEGQLIGPRAIAGALALPNGNTLLVGGVSALSNGGPATLLQGQGSMEIVSPSPPSGQSGQGMAAQVQLAYPRKSPTVMRLSNGQIVVGGGLDANDNPVPAIEWFDSGLTTTLAVLKNLVPGSNADGGVDGGPPAAITPALYAPLEGGALLAVLPGAPSNNVFVIGACDPTNCQPTVTQASPIGSSSQLSTANAMLFPAARAAPVLWTGSAWLRWVPWGGKFVPLAEEADASVGAAGPVSLLTGAGFAAVAADPGLAVWVGNNGSLYGYRYDNRSAYVNDTAIDETNTAPDRFVQSGALSTVGWNAGQPGLTISGGAKAFVTDATFGNVTIAATMQAALAGVILRSDDGCEYEIGPMSSPDPACPNPPTPPTPCDLPPLDATGEASITLTRSGSSVTWSVADGSAPSVTCSPGFAASARISVGFHGFTPGSILTAIALTRGS